MYTCTKLELNKQTKLIGYFIAQWNDKMSIMAKGFYLND